MVSAAWLGQFYELEWLKITQSEIFANGETVFKSQFTNIKILEKEKYIGEGITTTK